MLFPRIEFLRVSLPCDCPSSVERGKKIRGRTGDQYAASLFQRQQIGAILEQCDRFRSGLQI